MNININMLMDLIEVVAMFYAFMVLYFAYERFNPGEFKNILKWLLYSSLLIGFARSVDIASAYVLVFSHIFISYILFLAGIFSFTYTAFLIYKFSKVYGFAEMKERVVEFFEGNKKTRRLKRK